MDDCLKKIPNWLRYILAIPFGILCLYIGYYVGYFSNLYIASPDSWCMVVFNFVYNNGINVMVMISTMNWMLPKHQFKFTLVISIILCGIGLVGLGMSILMGSITIPYIIGLTTTIICFISMCCYTFKEFEKDKEKQNEKNVFSNDDKFIKLSNIIMQGLGVDNIDEALIKSYEFYKGQGIDMSNINLEDDNKYITLTRVVMLGIRANTIEEAIEKTTKSYQMQGIEIK